MVVGLTIIDTYAMDLVVGLLLLAGLVPLAMVVMVLLVACQHYNSASLLAWNIPG